MNIKRRESEFVVPGRRDRRRGTGGETEIGKLIHSCFQSRLVDGVVNDWQNRRLRATHTHERMLFVAVFLQSSLSSDRTAERREMKRDEER